MIFVLKNRVELSVLKKSDWKKFEFKKIGLNVSFKKKYAMELDVCKK